MVIKNGNLSVFVEKGRVDFVCPHCQKKIKGCLKKKIDLATVKCSECGESIHLSLRWKNERKNYRAPVCINGEMYYNNSHVPIEIHDLSIEGIGFVIKSKAVLQIGQIVRVKFILQDKQKSVIDVNIRICSLNDGLYGATFIEGGPYSYIAKRIGFAIKG